MAALQYVDVPIMPLFYCASPLGFISPACDSTCSGMARRYRRKMERRRAVWRFPSGASLSFGYLDIRGRQVSLPVAEYQFIGFDELTQFSESQSLICFAASTAQRLKRARCACEAPLTPAVYGHEWVKERLITKRCEGAESLSRRS